MMKNFLSRLKRPNVFIEGSSMCIPHLTFVPTSAITLLISRQRPFFTRHSSVHWHDYYSYLTETQAALVVKRTKPPADQAGGFAEREVLVPASTGIPMSGVVTLVFPDLLPPDVTSLTLLTSSPARTRVMLPAVWRKLLYLVVLAKNHYTLRLADCQQVLLTIFAPRPGFEPASPLRPLTNFSVPGLRGMAALTIELSGAVAGRGNPGRTLTCIFHSSYPVRVSNPRLHLERVTCCRYI
jgi:hypothetical protein